MDKEKEDMMKLLNSELCQCIMQADIFRISKNTQVSKNTRQLGNTRLKESFHSSSLHENILQLYSLSIAIAENKSEDLAIAYGNRSAVLIHLWMYKDCITDIDRALKITKNNFLKVKLLCRKAKCLHALESNEKKNVMHKAEVLCNRLKNDPLIESFVTLVETTKLSLDKPIGQKTASVCNNKKLALVKKLHEKQQINNFSSINIEYSKKYGRHLVANKDIMPGEILFIEKPYIHCLDLARGHSYCFNCLSPSLTNIPCDHCAWAMYCSENCKQEAWTEYHHLECSVYALAKETVASDGIKHLAIKCLLFGIREAGGFEQLKVDLQAFDKCTDTMKGFVKNNKIESDGFKSIYALASSTSDKNEKLHTMNTIKLLKSIAKNTMLLGKEPGYEKTKKFKEDENVLYLGSLLKKLSKICQLNSQIIPSGRNFCTRNLDVRICEKQRCCTAGLYIAPITSLLNHSCNPNVKRCFSNSYSVIVYAVQPIKKGSQIFDCYQQEFYEYAKSPRQKQLRRTFNFDCDCIACKNNWEIVEYEVVSKRSLKNIAVQAELVKEYLDLVKSIQKKKIESTEKHIDILAKGIKKACGKLSQPAFMTANLIRALNVVFKNLYGIEMNIPDNCNTV